MNTTNARFGSKRVTTVMVVVSKRQYIGTVASLRLHAMNYTAFNAVEDIALTLSDILQHKVVGVLGSHDVSGYTRDILAFLADSLVESGCSIQVNEWPGTLTSVTLETDQAKHTLLIGVPYRKTGKKHGKIREEKQTAYTCQIWGRGIE